MASAPWVSRLQEVPLSMDEKARAHEMIMGLPFEDREAAVPDDPEFATYVIKRRLANPGGTGPRPSSDAGPPRSPYGSDRPARVSDAVPDDAHAAVATTSRRFIATLPNATCATFVERGWLVSYAHGDHVTWELGAGVQVSFTDKGTEREVIATVAHKCMHPGGDYILLQVPHDVVGENMFPNVECAVEPGAQFVLVGASARSQAHSPASVRHGVVLSTRLDENSHMLGDCTPSSGDSGGGCFRVSTGALFAMCGGRSGAEGLDCAMLPIAVPQAKIRELQAAQSSVPS